MHPGLGHGLDDSTILVVTREIRWFHRGPIPTAVATWFAAIEGDHVAEQRIDHYDVTAASRGAGVKYRDATHMDSKFLLSRRRDIPLPPLLGGAIDDWVKISSPIDPETDISESQFLAIDKDMTTIPVSTHSGEAGCDIELVSIRSGDVEAWSICLETFGPPEMRADAFRLGVQFLASAKPPPLELTSPQNYGYPGWIADLTTTG